MLRFALALLTLAALSACSSLPTGSGPAQRTLDPLTEDLTALVLAFDVPQGVEPIERKSTFNFDAGPANGGRHLALGLVRADAGDITADLPPPGSERLYYLFAFTDADEAALREAQAWARGQGAAVSVALAPHFCRINPIDPATVSVAVTGLLPGKPPASLFARTVLADALQAAGGGFPDCV